ncbi:MAG: hypothetical protein R6V77_02040, partial [Candidatus Cloacimonadaceae bacterium]
TYLRDSLFLLIPLRFNDQETQVIIGYIQIAVVESYATMQECELRIKKTVTGYGEGYQLSVISSGQTIITNYKLLRNELRVKERDYLLSR